MAYTFPVLTVGSIVQATFRMTWCGQRLINTFHWRCEANPTGQLIDSALNDLDTLLSSAGNLYLSHKAARDGSCVLDDVMLQVISPIRYVPTIKVKAQNGDIANPTNTSDTPNLAAVITRRGVTAARRDVGCIHYPIPQSNTVYVDGELTVAYKVLLTALAGAMQAQQNLASGTQFAPVIYHTDGGSIYSYIGACFWQPYVRVMPRRTVGRGI